MKFLEKKLGETGRYRYGKGIFREVGIQNLLMELKEKRLHRSGGLKNGWKKDNTKRGIRIKI
jgi:hypothetical protein